MAGIRLSVVGQFSLEFGSGERRKPRPMVCALLAVLALSPGRSRSRGYLQDFFWEHAAVDVASTNLRRALADCRKVLRPLESALLTDRHTVCLDAQAVSVDIESAATLADAAAQRERTGEVPLILDGLGRVASREFEYWLAAAQARFELQVARHAAQRLGRQPQWPPAEAP